MDCAKEIEEMLEIKVCVDDELRTKKVIKFRLRGSGHTLTLLEFARRLGLYHADEINDEGFEGTLERMACRQLYHTDRYAGLFEHMAGHYRYTLQGAYAPPGYDEEQQDEEE
nr:hypothetical protein [Tanacetum cinerariifolium]